MITRLLSPLTRVPKVLLLLAALGIPVVLTRVNPFLYITPPGRATIIFNVFRGLQQGRIEPPGASWILPMVDRPITFNVRTQVWSFTDLETGQQAGPTVSVNSADGQAFTLEVHVALRPNPATLDDLYSAVGENYMETVVVPVVRAKVRDVAARFESEAFYNQGARQQIESQAERLIQAEMPRPQGNDQGAPLIEIEGVFLGTPSFPQALKDSIERRQVAAITAQTAGVRAAIQSQETERQLILARANQQGIELKGQAAAANAQLADFLFYEVLQRRIDEAKAAGRPVPLQVLRVEGGSTLFLNLDPRQAAVTAPNTTQSSP